MTNKDSLCKVNPYLFVSGIMDYNRDNRTWTIPFTTGYGWFGFESLDANEYTAEEAINKFVDILMEEQLTGMEENKSHE